LYVWGAKDPALGRAGATGTAAYVRGPYRFEVLPQAGHWLPERLAEEIAPQLLEHLGQG
jgi:pimeloyl-ACP methyl ester carboxylesterase